MNLAIYGILVILALFIVLMVFNPNLSCFGRKLKSPLYPVLRKRKQKKMKEEDYGFDLGIAGKTGERRTDWQKTPMRKRAGSKPNVAAEDYGFDLSGGGGEEQ